MSCKLIANQLTHSGGRWLHLHLAQRKLRGLQSSGKGKGHQTSTPGCEQNPTRMTTRVSPSGPQEADLMPPRPVHISSVYPLTNRVPTPNQYIPRVVEGSASQPSLPLWQARKLEMEAVDDQNPTARRKDDALATMEDAAPRTRCWCFQKADLQRPALNNARMARLAALSRVEKHASGPHHEEVAAARAAGNL